MWVSLRDSSFSANLCLYFVFNSNSKSINVRSNAWWRHHSKLSIWIVLLTDPTIVSDHCFIFHPITLDRCFIFYPIFNFHPKYFWQQRFEPPTSRYNAWWPEDHNVLRRTKSWQKSNIDFVILTFAATSQLDEFRKKQKLEKFLNFLNFLIFYRMKDFFWGL